MTTLRRGRARRLAVLAFVPLVLGGCSASSGSTAAEDASRAASAPAAEPSTAGSGTAGSGTAGSSTAGSGAVTKASCTPVPVSAVPDAGLRERPVGVLALVPAATVPPGWSPLDGSAVSVNDNSVLFSQLGTAFGGDARPQFRLPSASGPWARLPASDGTCLAWVLESVGYLPTERPVDGFPGQVYFTAVQADRFGKILVGAGARANDLGAAIAPGIRAYDLPTSWPAPDVAPMPGEVRLFSASAELPPGFSSTDLPAAPGYVWAVAG